MSGEARNASISEDGRYIAFEANPGGQFDIYRADNPLHDDFIV
jgi:Tol biopolymer transport system component